MRLMALLMLLAGRGSAAARQRERIEALERDMAAMKQNWEERERALSVMIADEVRLALETAGQALRSELRQGTEALSRRGPSPRLAQVKIRPAETDGTKAGARPFLC